MDKIMEAHSKAMQKKARRIAKLNKQLDKQDKQLMAGHTKWKLVLQREAVLREDKERLDWLEEQAPKIHFPDRFCTRIGTIRPYYRLDTADGREDGSPTFREAIDKARAALEE